MTITLPPELMSVLQKKAGEEGIAPEEVATRTLVAAFGTRKNAPMLSREEGDLLTVINDGFPDAFWIRFRELKARLDAEALSPDEHKEMIVLNAQIEGKNARRMAALLQLARLQNLTLPEIMKKLGVGPVKMPLA